MEKIKKRPIKKIGREFDFNPRVINPVKIVNAVVFSADERVRMATNSLEENMPWIDSQVFYNPVTVSDYRSDQASVLIFDDTAMTLVDSEKIYRNNSDVVLILLSSNDFIHRSPPSATLEKYPYTSKPDLIFAVNNSDFLPDNVITSAVRCAEDKLNIEKYSKERRFIFLLVDDEPRWFSQFLPVLYNIIGQRADVMVTRTYEEAVKFLFGVDAEEKIDEKKFRLNGHGDDVVCVITDIFFPKGKVERSDAGKDLINLIKKYYPRIPMIVASKAKEAYELKDIAFILPKGDPGSLQTLKQYIHDFTGMGDFVINSMNGQELYRIRNIREMIEVLLIAEKNTEEAEQLRGLLELLGKNDCFSTWLYMHGYRELGDKLRPKRAVGRALVDLLKGFLVDEVSRMNQTPLIIDDIKVFNLDDLVHLFSTADSAKIQWSSDNDLFSTWLDFQGYSELAEELRPIHFSGAKLEKVLIEITEKWVEIYKARGER